MDQKGIFLDRDGTLILDKHYLCDPEDVELTPGAKEFVHKARQKGYKLYLFTNQSGVARGYFSLEKVHACNEKMYELLGVSGFDGECIATEHPEGAITYRKPSNLYLEETIERDKLNRQQTWMVGDKTIDIETGIKSNVRCAWVATGKAKTEELDILKENHFVLELNTLEQLLEYLD